MKGWFPVRRLGLGLVQGWVGWFGSLGWVGVGSGVGLGSDEVGLGPWPRHASWLDLWMDIAHFPSKQVELLAQGFVYFLARSKDRVSCRGQRAGPHGSIGNRASDRSGHKAQNQ